MDGNKTEINNTVDYITEEKDLYQIEGKSSYLIQRDNDRPDITKFDIMIKESGKMIELIEKGHEINQCAVKIKETSPLLTTKSYQMVAINYQECIFLVPISGIFRPRLELENDKSNIKSNHNVTGIKPLHIKYKRETQEESIRRLESYTHQMKVAEKEQWIKSKIDNVNFDLEIRNFISTKISKSMDNLNKKERF